LSNTRTLRGKFQRLKYEFSLPCFFERMAEARITLSDVHAVMYHGQIKRVISRDFDRPLFVIQRNENNRSMNVVCTLKRNGILLLITVFGGSC
jgi:hypothetical protein